jgi:hypothetical protein
MSFETIALVLAVWIGGSIPVALFVGRFIRLGSTPAPALRPARANVVIRHYAVAGARI